MVVAGDLEAAQTHFGAGSALVSTPRALNRCICTAFRLGREDMAKWIVVNFIRTKLATPSPRNEGEFLVYATWRDRVSDWQRGED
jgi:hypothetical protein